jgi:hypothetical protein
MTDPAHDETGFINNSHEQLHGYICMIMGSDPNSAICRFLALLVAPISTLMIIIKILLMIVHYATSQ